LYGGLDAWIAAGYAVEVFNPDEVVLRAEARPA